MHTVFALLCFVVVIHWLIFPYPSGFLHWHCGNLTIASKATLMNMDKYFMWIHYEPLRNHNKAKHNKTVCIFLGIYCTCLCSTSNSMVVYGTVVEVITWMCNYISQSDMMCNYLYMCVLATVFPCYFINYNLYPPNVGVDMDLPIFIIYTHICQCCFFALWQSVIWTNMENISGTINIFRILPTIQIFSSSLCYNAK